MEDVNGLNNFIDVIGIPMNMPFDHAVEFLGEGTEFMKSTKKNSTNWNVTEPYSHWHNQADDDIKCIKHRWKSTIQRTGYSPIIWDYGMKQDAELLSCIAPKDGRPPLEKLIGDTINLSEYLDLGFYDLVWYWDTLRGERARLCLNDGSGFHIELV